MHYLLIVIRAILAAWTWIAERFRRFDRAMRDRYHPAQLAAVAVVVLTVIVAALLLFPPYLGMSNDGSFDNVMRDVGLERIDPTDDAPYFSFYERLYRISPQTYRPDTTPQLQRWVIRQAITLDLILTGDDCFDMRFLAGVYLVLYAAVLYPFFKWVLSRVKIYSEGLALAVIGVAVFSDASLVTRFASLYVYPLELILVLAVVDGVLYSANRQGEGAAPLMLAVSTALLMEVNPYCSLAGIVVSLVYWMLAGRKVGALRRTLFVLAALVLCMGSVVSLADMVRDQTPVQKYNQMTRGVLFQATDPEKALAEFGIEPRYSVLTETYAEQEFPVVLPSSGTLDEGFFDRYTTTDVLLHYLRHPGALFGLLDVGVYDSFNLQPSYNGNFERSVGLPAMAKAPFPLLWSTFKAQSAPKTVGFLMLLLMVFVLAWRKKDQSETERMHRAFVCVLTLMFFAELFTALLMAGDSEMLHESFVMGVGIDVLATLFLSEVLSKTKMIQDEESESGAA